MASILNNILDYIRVNDEDDYDYDEFDDVKEEPVVSSTRRSESAERKSGRKGFARERDMDEQEEVQHRSSRSEKANSKVVPMRAVARGLEVCIVKPTSFEDSQQVCDILLNGRACVVNLEGFDVDDSQRIMDFISGCIFSINGKLHRISKYIFIFAPDNIDISGDYLDLLPDDKKNMMTINKEF